MLRRDKHSQAPLHVAYVDDEGREVTLTDVRMIPTAGPGTPAAVPR